VPHRKASLDALRSLLDGHESGSVATILGGLRAEEIAVLMRELSDAEVYDTWERLHAEDPDLAVEVLPLLDRHDVSRVVDELPDEKVAGVLEEMGADDATYVLELMEDHRVEPIVAAMDPEESREVRERLEYPEGSAGRLMSDEFLALPATATAAEAVRRVQEASEDVTIVYVYLVDDAQRLRGVVSLRTLLRVKPERKLLDVAPATVTSVRDTDDQEHVAQVMGHHDFVAIPVVDEGGRLVGVVTHDDVIDVMREEATEDILALAGTSADDVISESVWYSARLRMPWLFAAFVIEMIAVKVISTSEKSLGDLFVTLALFMPAISAMTGNIGVQASTIVVRGLATGRIRRHDSLVVFWRELRTAVVCACVYGTVLALVSEFVLHRGHLFSVVVGLGLLVSMSLASAFGTLVPIAFHAVKIDPAVATGPLVTTSMDVLAFLTYFTLAGWLLVR
jgi:magnesium transporter